METLIEKLAAFTLAPARPDGAVHEKARAAICDTVGCILAGCQEPSIRAALLWAKQKGERPQSTVLGVEPLQTGAATAAMVNAMAAYACDFDDMCEAGCGHPSMPVFPVALALSETTGASGPRMLEAYIRGVEVSALVGRGFPGSGLSLCWNPTTVCGGFGAAAAAAILLGLDREQTAAAYALMASEAGGTKANYGTPAKDVSAGLLCARAVASAQLAAAGIRGNPAALEGHNGLFEALAPGYNLTAVEQWMASGESAFCTPGIIPKPYPCCRSNHNAVDGMLHIRKEFGVTPEQVKHITCRVDAPSMALDSYHRPQTPEQGKFSTAYCVALALLNGKLTLEDFTGEHIRDTRVFPLIEKVDVELDDSFQDAHFGNEITVELVDGRRYTYRGTHAKGDAANPMTGRELEEKFFACAGRYFPSQTAQALYDLLLGGDPPSAGQIVKTICGERT